MTLRNAHLHKIVLIILVGLCLSVQAYEKNAVWQFDSNRAKSTPNKSDAQDVYELLLHMLDRWNAHDLEGDIACYWNSPELLVVVDSEQINGWQQLHDFYIKDYPDRSLMGFANSTRIQVKLLKPDLALALTSWSMSFPNSKYKVVETTTMNLQKMALTDSNASDRLRAWRSNSLRLGGTNIIRPKLIYASYS